MSGDAVIARRPARRAGRTPGASHRTRQTGVSMDRSYKEDIPKYRAALEELKQKFSALDSNTDWTALRIEPLLKHVKCLDQILTSPEFAARRPGCAKASPCSTPTWFTSARTSRN